MPLRNKQMKAKDFLKQYEYAVMKAKRCHEQYAEAMEKMDTIRSSLDTDGMPHGSGVTKRTQDLVERLVDAGGRYLKAEEEALSIKEEVEDVINRVSPGVKGAILYERYIHLSKWEDIAELLTYSISNVFKLHGQALEEVEEIINHEQ